MPSILIVCTANVCRSPLAAIRLRVVLAGAGLAGSVRVESAGSAAAGDGSMCSHAAARLAGDADSARMAASHVSRRLTTDMLDGADLVLVPDLANRARVVSLRPSVRNRTLLLRDAAAHSSGVPARGGGRHLAAEGQSPSPRVLADSAFAGWVEALRTARMSAPHVTAHRFSFRPHSARDLEISDGHNLGSRRHRQTLDAVEASVTTIARSLVTVDAFRPFDQQG